MQNSAYLSGANPGTTGFFELTHSLRRLQEAGVLAIRYQKEEKGQGRVFLTIGAETGSPSNVQDDVRLVRTLLHTSQPEIELVYGAGRLKDGKVGIITRSMQGILSEIGAQVRVAEEDVNRHAVMPTVGVIGVETRPIIVIHVGTDAPAGAYAEIVRGGRHYWIDDNDFDSKFAFSVVQNLIALAESSQSGKQALVTIPATP
ncbi:MAG: hypothetical protein JO002_07010 [Burkholderiaceae bacterium]|nr:hypothetical protein [Burkholderiaceae bacterium]